MVAPTTLRRTRCPPLSPCLRGTLLAWVPCVFLWLAAPFEFYRIACSDAAPLRWSVLSSIKMILSAATASAHLVFAAVRGWPADGGIHWHYVQALYAAITTISIYTDTMEYRSWSNSGAHMQCGVLIMSLAVLVMNSFADLSRREKQRVRAPVTESSFPSRMTFQWMNPLIVKGFRTTLSQDDIPALADDMDPAACSDMLQRHWRPEPGGPGGGKKLVHRRSLLFSLLKAFAGPLIQIAALETVFCVGMFLPIYLMDVLIQFGGSREPTWKGYLLPAQVLTAWSTGGEQRSAGEVINSITLDSDKVYQAVLFAGELWGAPLRLLITMAMLWQYLGPSCLVAVAVVLVVLIASFFFARRVQVVQTAQMEKKDKRVKYVHELFSGIKILKLYAWEEPFQQRVVDVRKSEMEMLRKIAFYFSLMNFVWNCISFLVSLVTFMTFLMVGSHGLDPVTAFVSLALFNTLRFSLLLIPDLIVGCVVCNVAMGRMKDFLLSEDVDPKQVGSQPDPGDAGQLVAVVGQVGSGKTSLLSAILGELRCVKGSLDRKGKVAYVAQQAWIQNATVRQNILLKRQYHSCFYGRIVQACQLQTDLAELAAGDQTEVGMRGVTLSGGQKQRINLARAVYQNADLYIMDDPLSAVDAQVGSALFHGVIGPRGLLRKKTRVLATNTMSVLPLTDMVIVLHEGRVKEIYRPPYGQRLFDKGLALNVLISSQPAPHQQPQQQQGAPDGGAARALIRATHDDKTFELTSGEMSSMSVTMSKRPNPQANRSAYVNPGHLVEEEASFRPCGSAAGVRKSSRQAETRGISDNGWRLSVYGLLGMSQGLSILLGTLVLALCALIASSSIHDEALNRLVRAPMSFFDTTPLGRMLNRFSKDLDQADIQIGIVLDSVLEQLSDVLGILLLITLYIPSFLPAIAPCAIVYFIVQKLFVRTFRQLQRLESVSRSPVFNCIAETVPGVQTIRAYAVQRGFVALSDSLLEHWISCAFHLMGAERWLTVRLNFLGTAVSLVTACLLVHGRDTFGQATIGLTLLYALKVTDAMNFLVRFTAELENSLIACGAPLRVHQDTDRGAVACDPTAESRLATTWCRQV
ncbi:hypothetical protein MTO96_007461 [Rhipicephalus appendiculatus]